MEFAPRQDVGAEVMPGTLLLISQMTDAQLRQAYRALRGTRVLELQFLREAIAMEIERRRRLGRRPPRGRRAFCPGASPPDNSCPPANKGTGGGDAFLAGGEVEELKIRGVDRLDSLRPASTVYDPQSLIDAGPPSAYEGGELRDGQTLWDRHRVGTEMYLSGRYDSEASPGESIAGVFAEPYAESSKSQRDKLDAAMPLRVQQAELREVARQAASGLEREERSSAARVAYQFSSSVTNEAVSLMSHISPSPEVQAERDKQIDMLRRASPDTEIPSQEEVDRFSELARTTALPAGVTLFHGIKGAAAQERLDRLSQERGTIMLNKLTSTTTRPAVATQFGRTTSRGAGEKAGPGDFTEGGEFVHRNGTLASVVRIRDASRGFPISGTSAYRDEAEVVVAPGTQLRFTGESRVVFMPAANDSGWPAATFSIGKAKQRGARYRVLWPVTVYDAVMEGD
jgi:hypothetical protein